MVRKASERSVTVNENMRGGPGSVELVEIATKSEMYSKARLYTTIILKPGCGIGYHVHHDESEIFLIISGTAAYNDDGVECILGPGDVSIVTSGHGHSITNKGTEDVKLIALIPLA